MGLAGLDFQPLHIPFAAGINTKGDPRAQEPPLLDLAYDVQFDNVGGLETRKPYAAVGANILGGGTLANVRRVFSNGPELCCLTVDTLYSWSARDTAWVSRGTHLAVATAEADVFADPGDQHDADRAELSNTVVYAWVEGTHIFAAAKDKTTGAVIAAPTAVSSAGATPGKPRLVTLNTRILLFWTDTVAGGPALVAIAIDPANVATSLAAAATTVINTVGGIAFNSFYDVARAPGTDTAVIATCGNPTTSYIVASVNSSLTVASAAKARTCSSQIGVACHPDALHFQVARVHGANLDGDYMAIASFTDVNTAQAIDVGHVAGSTRIAMAYRSVQNGGHYRCYVFFQDTDPAVSLYSNWVDDNNALGASATFGNQLLNIASRAIDYNGSVYFWVVFREVSPAGSNAAGFPAQLQNTYFLYRDDATYWAKAAAGVAGDIAATGYLPNIALTSGATGFSWCGVRKRRIPLGVGQLGYSTERVPHDITFTFDSSDARRTARIGNTLYIGGGEILQYDGTRISEVGFHTYPWTFTVTDNAAGNLAAGVYAYKMTWEWPNAAGELDRSTTATVAEVTMGASRKARIASYGVLPLTRKTANAPAAKVWRTAVAPTAAAPFYLATSSDPSATSNPNRYLSSNASAIFDDNLADASLTVLQNNPENPGVLPNIVPPPASIIAATDTRIYLAGVAGDLNSVWYSKQRNPGEVVAFNDALTIPVPLSGGNITGLGFLNETSVVVFRQRAIYAFDGTGFDNTGGGNGYSAARLISLDVGAVNADAIALTPLGLVFFSSKGWYLLDRSWQVHYIGAPVSKYDTDTVYAVHCVESQHQIRCLTNARMLVYDYYVNQWAEWTISDGLHATMWSGTYVYAATGGPKQEQATWTSLTYGLDVETSWIKIAGLMGRGFVRLFQLLGEWRSDHNVRIRVAVNYASDGAGGWTYVDDVKPPAPAPTLTAGSPLEVRHGPSVKRVQAIKVRITAVANDGTNNPPTGEALRLTGLALEVGAEPGLYKGLSAAQKAG